MVDDPSRHERIAPRDAPYERITHTAARRLKRAHIFYVNLQGSLFHSIEESERCSAFTVAELGEMLPDGYQTHKNIKASGGIFEWVGDHKYPMKWNKDVRNAAKHSSTEADARAKMLIYLLENKLI